MPFGMKTAPATFQRMMSETVLKQLAFADAYIADVEVDTPTSFPLHVSELRQVLQRLRESKLNARPSKFEITMSVVTGLVVIELSPAQPLFKPLQIIQELR